MKATSVINVESSWGVEATWHAYTLIANRHATKKLNAVDTENTRYQWYGYAQNMT
jgi:hypothetical protein